MCIVKFNVAYIPVIQIKAIIMTEIVASETASFLTVFWIFYIV